MAELPYHLPRKGMTVGELTSILKRKLKEGEIFPDTPLCIEAFTSETPKQEDSTLITLRLVHEVIDAPYTSAKPTLVLYCVKPGTDAYISADFSIGDIP